MASKSFIDLAGLKHYDEMLRQDLANPKHSYTTAANAAKGYYRIANAVTSQIDPDVPLHLQFFLRAKAEAEGVNYWQSWFIDLECWGQNSGMRIFGNSQLPFNYVRLLYENTVASVTSSTRPAVDINLNYVLAAGTEIEIEEVYNSGFEFVADGILAASTIPSGYESRSVSTNSNGIQYASNASYADRTQLLRSDISSNITLADNDTYRCRVLNCTGIITVTVPSLNSGYAWFVIKNNNAATGNITIHPSTTSVMIDGSNDDIVLRPKESLLLESRAANSYVILHDCRRRTAIVGRSGEVGSQTKHWFLVAETTESAIYRDVYLEAKVFTGAGLSLYGGVLSAHARIDGTKGVVSNKQLHWQWKNEGINPDDFALTNIDISGTSTKLQLWWRAPSSYSSIKFIVTAEHAVGDELDVHKWKLTRARKTEGDLENFDTGFTSVTTSSVLTLSNSIAGTASNVTGTVAIANGGTGETTRLNAIKALTNEKVGTEATDFITAKTGWSKCGYTSVADAKTVLGLKSAAYTESSAYAEAGHTHDYLPLSGGYLTGELKITAETQNQLRLIQGNYGVILRNDGTSFYILKTASGSAESGGWDSARPLQINLSSGTCSINGNAASATKANALASSVTPLGSGLTYTSGGVAIGSSAGQLFKGSSNDASLLSAPESGTYYNTTTGNVQNLRLSWSSDGKYLTDIFASPNNDFLWHRNVVNTTARPWRRLVEENASGITSPSWNISISGNAGTATKATQDASGNVITTTYATKAELLDIGSVPTEQIDALFE